MGTIHHQEAVERVQAILDETGHRDYLAYCSLLNDLAHYAASKGWNLALDAKDSVIITTTREAA